MAKGKKLTKVLDAYIKKPLLWDNIFIALLAITYFLTRRWGFCNFVAPADNMQSLLHELVSSSVSIGGFVIAALTIVITFKENLKAKEAIGPAQQPASPTSGLDLLFKSHHYKGIVNVFYWSALIFIFSFLYFCILEIFWDELKLHLTLSVCLIGHGVLMMVFAVTRCLLVLNQVVKLQMKDLMEPVKDEPAGK